MTFHVTRHIPKATPIGGVSRGYKTLHPQHTYGCLHTRRNADQTACVRPTLAQRYTEALEYRKSHGSLRLYSTSGSQARSLTEDDAEQYASGTHPALQKPAHTDARNSLIVDTYTAPSVGVIKVLTLNELRTLNALSKQMTTELSEEVESIHSEQKPGETRVVIVRSAAEKAFCAGANLKERADMSIDEYVLVSSVKLRYSRTDDY